MCMDLHAFENRYTWVGKNSNGFNCFGSSKHEAIVRICFDRVLCVEFFTRPVVGERVFGLRMDWSEEIMHSLLYILHICSTTFVSVSLFLYAADACMLVSHVMHVCMQHLCFAT